MTDKVLLVADLHVSDTMGLAGMRPVDRESGWPLVLVQAERTLEWVANVATSEDVSWVFVLGDLYHSPRPSPACQLLVSRWLRHLTSWGVRVGLVAGNHDAPRGGGVDALAPLAMVGCPMVRVLGPGETMGCCLGRLDVAALPYYLPRAQGDNPVESRAAEQAAAVEVMRSVPSPESTLLLAHGTVEGATWSGWQTVPASDRPIPLEEVERFAFSAWGHIHKAQSLGTTGHHHYVGAADRHAFGEAGHFAGCAVLGIDSDGVASFARRDNPTARRWETLTPGMLREREEELERGGACIYRVCGDVSPEVRDEVAATCRSLVARGVVIRAEVDVERTARVRAQEVTHTAAVSDLARSALGQMAQVSDIAPDVVSKVAGYDSRGGAG